MPQPATIRVSEAPVPATDSLKRIAKQTEPQQDRPQVQPAEFQPAVAPNLGHAPDHHWLVGRLEQEEQSKRWYVRYADSGENDRFGGRLELVGTGPMAGFHPGQVVRAEGKLLDPEPLQTQPGYRITSLQALRR